jgi:hypothetical protein
MKKSWLFVCLASVLLVGLIAQVTLAQPQGLITSPRDRAAVRGLVPIEGIATHAQFWKYELHFGPEPNPGDQWTPITGSPFSVPVVQGRLALWDTTIIPDGIYSLRLRLVRTDGNYEDYFVRGILVSNTQPTEVPTPKAPPTRAAPTNTPAPTPTIVIGVPTVSSPTPKPSDTPLPTVQPTATEQPVKLPLGISGVGDAVFWAGGGTLALFAGVGLLFALKGWLVSLARWLARRGQESRGVFED